jgi:hypothetical protein
MNGLSVPGSLPMLPSLMLVLLLGQVMPEAPAGSPQVACEAGTSPPIDPRHRVEDLSAFDRAHAGMTVAELVVLLGPATADVGSGLHVLVWEARDGRRLRVSAANLCQPVIAFHRFDR